MNREAAQSTPEYYHASRVPLESGLVLEHRFIRPDLKYQFQAIQGALNEPPEARATILKTLLLSDFVQNSGKSRLTFAVKETILEHVRKTEFPQRISRYQAIFTVPTRKDAMMFRELVRRESDDRPHLHICRINGEVFTADLRYVSSPNLLDPMLKQVEYLIERSRFYWDGKHSDTPILECLAEPDTVTIVEAVTW